MKVGNGRLENMALVALVALMAFGAFGLAAACSGGGQSAKDGSSMSAKSVATDQARTTLTDANILALLEAANEVDLHGGRVAQRRASDPQVKNFARRMEAEHEMLLRKGREASAKMNITPQLGFEGQKMLREHSDQMAVLQTQSGPSFDQQYMQQEIQMHEQLLHQIDRAARAAQQPELKQLLERTRPAVQEHLRLARALEQRISDRPGRKT
jgi:putative membrane protein